MQIRESANLRTREPACSFENNTTLLCLFSVVENMCSKCSRLIHFKWCFTNQKTRESTNPRIRRDLTQQKGPNTAEGTDLTQQRGPDRVSRPPARSLKRFSDKVSPAASQMLAPVHKPASRCPPTTWTSTRSTSTSARAWLLS